VTLAAARKRLAAGDDTAKRIDELLSFELGGEEEDFNATGGLGLAAKGGDGSQNKTSMKVFKDLSKLKPPRFLKPHEDIIDLRGAEGVRVYALGPPCDEDKIEDLDPVEEQGESFGEPKKAKKHASFAAALAGADGGEVERPFATRYAVNFETAAKDTEYGDFFGAFYAGAAGHAANTDEIPSNAEFRRIDKDWLMGAEQLALAMSNDTNNASLVLAFEIVSTGKVLLFVGDAQRGNWASWADKDFKDGGKTITVKDLLARTVLYKVGHHGSHNATLNGKLASKHANLEWMGQGKHGREFTAMITAVRAWAETQKGWDHPLKAIKDALLEKTSGRVLQTDTNFDDMKKKYKIADDVWDDFGKRVKGERLYFDVTIE
jgi:hypothetical protein